MTAHAGAGLVDTGVDAVAIKPASTDLEWVRELPLSTVAIDYEGRAHIPDPEVLAELAAERTVRLTAPVRADGYDPRGEDGLLRAVPESVGLVAVAGHPAYLSDRERARAVAPRLRAVAERASDPWVGTESIERVALAVGGTQYELLSATTEREVRALRAAGFEGEVAVYAPTVLSEDGDAILDSVGAYVARRPGVRVDGESDSEATGETRERLLAASREYALVGDAETVADRVAKLHAAGVDQVVAHPARGVGRISGER